MDRQGDGVRLRNRADAFGSFARWGLRLARALYSAAAARPSLLASGKAHVQLPGKAACYLIDRKTLQALTGGTGIIRCSEPWPECRADWDRCRSAGGTGGWRLVSMPEPGISAAGLALAPAACRLGDRAVILWRVASAAGLADLIALNQAGIDILGVVEDIVSSAVPGSLPCVPASGGAKAIVDALRERWGGPREAPAAQALEGLLAEIDVRGFIPEEQVAAALGCISLDELPPRLLSLDPARGTYVQGVGLCTPGFVEAMRKGLRRKPRRVPAA